MTPSIPTTAWSHPIWNGEIAIAGIIARPSITAPIASATTIDQLGTLLAATHLTLDDATIDAAISTTENEPEWIRAQIR